MALLLSSSGASAETPRPLLLAHFGAGDALGWYSVNDDVMGGRSLGAFEIRDGVLAFEGATNTDGGGFASIRTRDGALDLSGFDGIRLRVRGDGRRYTFRLTTSTARHRGHPLPYRSDFETAQTEAWSEVELPFADFRPRFRGRVVPAPALDRARVESLGIQIYDKRDGPFRLEVDRIQAYAARAPFSMSSYLWKRRPLLVFAPHADDARWKQQLAAIEASRADFDERDMALVVVFEEGASAADGARLTPAEAGTLRERYRVAAGDFAVKLVGKDGALKQASDDVAPMERIYARIDEMPMRQREARRR